jgi:hypothetical protein
MGLSRTERKALRDYPERFAKDGQDDTGWDARYGLWTYLSPCGECACEVECYCTHDQVFSIVGDTAEDFHEGVRNMECCPCCGSWYQDPSLS